MGILGHLLTDCYLFVLRKLEGPAIGYDRTTHRDGSFRGFADPQASAAAPFPKSPLEWKAYDFLTKKELERLMAIDPKVIGSISALRKE